MAKWIPLFETSIESLAWPILILFTVILYRAQFARFVSALADRVVQGAHFSVGPGGVVIGPPPPEISKSGQPLGVTAEGVGGIESKPSAFDALAKDELPANVVESLYLVHEAQVVRRRTGRMPGLYRVRVVLEGYSDAELKGVTRVTYRLHDTFPNRMIATEAGDRDFELWLNVFGEFTIIAVVECDGREPLWLTRYLDLPGRPPE